MRSSPAADGPRGSAFRKVQIGWRKKAAAFRLFDSVPGGRLAYYLAQRYITRTIPRDLAEHCRWPVEHATTFRTRFDGDLGRARLFEFGAGWDLFNSLVQWCYGVNDQVVVDIDRWARSELIDLAIRYLQTTPPPGSRRVPTASVGRAFEPALATHYGIQYRAPHDARATGLSDGTVDLICTTSVLEHIPVDALNEIVRECHRICSPRGVMSHVVDYTDHYAHSDPAITFYNFLRFSDREWQPFNPRLHYQNRLRHFEYGELFERHGFVAVEERATAAKDAEALLERIPLSDRFRGMDRDRLTAATGYWVLRKR